MVEDQIRTELDEVLELNNPETLLSRATHFGTGTPDGYLNRQIETSEGAVIAGIRHLGGDKDKPFIFIWPSFDTRLIKNVIDEITPHFSLFQPLYYNYWCRPEKNLKNEQVFQQRFIGSIIEMTKADTTPLVPADDYWNWYEAEYRDFHQQNPEYKYRIPINDRETMEQSRQEGLLYFFMHNNQKAGLIAGEQEIFLGKPSVYLNEILISSSFKGQGLANRMLASFVATLEADYFNCNIDVENIPSTRTALRSGQKIFSQEVFVSF
ncbi:hypothetical protein [Parendozoicomonas haliclonae]|uniref:N-acetyltransferase domain-containing protein n=1 Tax=Parendozoicomonas haliclonae TaxID=1960125 RepID=A0A1X7AEJ1_9GAMM|nr:hypothetical protein [Parendozoicomonas haliclonae]SMA34751.1 hypothetical protein EHSB41UT_00445 [Parendozoicomonas haliclonae]